MLIDRYTDMRMSTAIILILIVVVAFVIVACRRGSTAGGGSLSPATTSRYKPGQVWSFQTPADQPQALLTVLKVESHPKLSNIVHIALSGVSFSNGGTNVQHMPFAEAAIDKSVISLIREGEPLPQFQGGYQQWRDAFDAGRGGVFTITVAEGLETIRTAIAKNTN
jgi:hypothetical protein